MGNLLSLLHKQGMGASPSLRQVWLKTKFHMVTQEFACTSKAFSVMVDEGLVALASTDEGDASSLELWFRTMVHEAWIKYLAGPADESDILDQVLRLGRDAKELHKLLSEIPDEALRMVLRPVCEDMWCFATLFGLWQPDDIDAAEVEKAVEHLKAKRMANIQGCFASSDVGREILSKSAVVLQSSGQAIAADAKFQNALKLLSDSRLPAVRELEGAPTFVNREMVSDSMMVIDVLGESLDLLEQSIELWSRPSRSQHATDVQGCIASLLHHVCLTEECLIFDLTMLLSKSGVDKLIMEGPRDRNSWNADEASRCFAELAGYLQVHFSNDEPLVAFVQRLTAFMRSMPVEICPREKVEATITESLTPLVDSAEARQVLEGVLRLMSDVFTDPDASSSAFFEEIKRCTSPLDLDKTRLSKAVRLQTEVDALRTKKILATGLKNVLYETSLDQEEGASPTLSVWPDTAPDLLASLPNMGALPMLDGVVVDCLQQVLKEIATTTCLASLKLPGASMPSGDSPVEKLLDGCMKCSVVNGKPVDTWLKSGASETAWPSTAPTKMACDILKMLAIRGKRVGASPLCAEDEEEEKTMVDDLGALEQVIKVIEVMGKVGRLLAWVKTNFCQARAAQLVTNATIHSNLEQVLTAAGHFWMRHGS